MNKKTAAITFLCVCFILAVLLLTDTISNIESGIIFAIALVLFGSLSKGFRNDTTSSNVTSDKNA